MKHIITCENCKTENPFYNHICKNCNSYLRERIFNLNLWETFGELIYNPVKAFRTIIYAEHKNFIIFILFIVSAKFFIDSMFIALASGKKDIISFDLFLTYLIILAIIIIITVVYAVLLKYLNNLAGLKSRFRDNLATLTYSFIPHLFALFILFTVEVIVFGNYLFTANPSPFMLKETLAYLLLGIEILIILWSIFLSIIGIYTETRNILYSVVTGIIFHVLIFLILYQSSKILYL